jgi:hypothetical protein
MEKDRKSTGTAGLHYDEDSILEEPDNEHMDTTRRLHRTQRDGKFYNHQLKTQRNPKIQNAKS